jgi:hypothetical protein
MVRVKVGRDEIRSLQGHADLVETRLEDLPAFRPVHARIDDEISIFGSQHVGVDFLERIPGERHHHAVETGQDLFDHLRHPQRRSMVAERAG